MAIIGIDLGTTNSLAAVWRGGKSELIPNAAGEFLTPSAVSIDEDGAVLVGRAARERLITHPERTAAGFKRAMGTAKRYTLGDRAFSPEELSAFVLRRLREDAEAFLGEPVTEAVISVPAYFAEAQRAATKRAGFLAGLTVERLVNEPSAAAVAGRISEGGEDKVCLVFDLGGGTLDVSLVERFDNVVSITAVSGDNRLGGGDFDLAIAQGFCQDCGLEFTAFPRRQQEMLLRQAEACKIALTVREPVLMAVSGEGLEASLMLTNEWLIRKAAGLFQRLSAPIRRVFMDAGVSAGELDELIMVGGSSRMPAVVKYIAKLLERAPSPDARPDTAIALGVGVCAGMKARVPGLRELVLTDVCPFSLGVAVNNPIDPRRSLMSPIIERNSVLPSSKAGRYYTAHDGQTQVDVEVYQGEKRYCDENIPLGRLSIQVAPAPRGQQSVSIRFTYDINGLLEIEVTSDDGTKARLLLRDPSGGLSPEEAEQRLQELQCLKLSPRDREENRALLARGERLYMMTVGSIREQVAGMLDWFQAQLATQETPRIIRAAKRADAFFDQVEAYLGQGDIPDDSLRFDPYSESEG